MTIQPMNEHVLLRPIDAEERTAGGLYLPDTAREKPSEGVILAVPAGGAEGLAIGDRVIYKAHAGEEIRADRQTFRLVPVGELLGKYVEADTIAA
jgi:chaperonin GroES